MRPKGNQHHGQRRGSPGAWFPGPCHPSILATRRKPGALLRLVVPDLADGFLCERARPLEREFLLGDWRRRESDVLVEVP